MLHLVIRRDFSNFVPQSARRTPQVHNTKGLCLYVDYLISSDHSPLLWAFLCIFCGMFPGHLSHCPFFLQLGKREQYVMERREGKWWKNKQYRTPLPPNSKKENTLKLPCLPLHSTVALWNVGRMSSYLLADQHSSTS